MHSIPWLTDLQDLSGVEIFFLIVIVIIASLATGFVIEVITRETGFGTFFNAILALAGACGGIYLRYRFLAPYRADDLMLTMGCAMAASFVLLFVAFLAKSRLF